MKDAEGYIWRYDYDRMNRMLSMVDPLGNAEIYTYNRNGWKINETAKDGGTTVKLDGPPCVITIRASSTYFSIC